MFGKLLRRPSAFKRAGWTPQVFRFVEYTGPPPWARTRIHAATGNKQHRPATHTGVYLGKQGKALLHLERHVADFGRICLNELSSMLAGVFELHMEDAILPPQDIAK